MGMSSSQARLLNLTARMHQIEYKAAKLEAQKLQMANKSRRVYEDYLKAIDSAKIQFKTLNRDGSVTYKDACLASLENGAVRDWEGLKSDKVFLVQNANKNEVYVTQQFAETYGITEGEIEPLPEFNAYLFSKGLTQIPEKITVPDYTQMSDIHPVENIVTEAGTETYTTYHYSATGSLMTPNVVNQPAEYRYTVYGTLPSISTNTTTGGGAFINQVTQKSTVPDGWTAITSAEQLSSISGNGRYILMNDIYFSSTNTPISDAFSGTFDGNGHIIAGTTNVLFDAIGYGATIQNLGIETNSLNDRAFLAEKAVGSGINISNCYIVGTNHDATAGSDAALFYQFCVNAQVNVSDTYVNVTRTTASYGNFAVAGSTSSQDRINLTNFYAQLAGYSQSGVASGSAVVNGTASTATPATYPNITGTTLVLSTNQEMIDRIAVASFTYDSNKRNIDYYRNQLNGLSTIQLASLIRCFDSDGQAEAMMGTIVNGGNLSAYTSLLNPSDYTSITQTDRGYRVTDNSTPEIQSVTTASIDDIANTLGVAVHNYLGNAAEETQLSTYVNRIKSNFTEKELSSLSQYANNSTKAAQIVAALAAGDGACAKAAVAALSSSGIVMNSYDDYTISHAANNITVNETQGTGTRQNEKGIVDIPLTSEIASNLVVGFRRCGFSVDDENSVKAKLILGFGTDLGALATINNAAVAAANSGAGGAFITTLYNYLCGSGSKPSIGSTYSSDNYDFTQSSKGNCQVTYGTQEVETGRMVWDTSDPDYIYWAGMYRTQEQLIASEYTYKIVDDDLAQSTEFLANLLVSNDTVLIDFDGELDGDFEDTSVAVETSLQEVPDEKLIKKAEAKYEADMKQIDMKDRKYDHDLSALDAERNAIKQEMETLKTVAKDNVERTFKLFG